MKKVFMTLFAAAALVLASCSASPESLIDDLKSKVEELNKANQTSDYDKVESIEKDIEEIFKKLQELDKDGKLSDEQKAEIAKIMF